MKKSTRKMALNRETLRRLEEDQLHLIAAGGTYTYSFPCCPPTRPKTHCC
jgi:formate-dependent phosphoribosylglycinamide formyltransferase (GAR transformylase)